MKVGITLELVQQHQSSQLAECSDPLITKRWHAPMAVTLACITKWLCNVFFYCQKVTNKSYMLSVNKSLTLLLLPLTLPPPYKWHVQLCSYNLFIFTPSDVLCCFATCVWLLHQLCCCTTNNSSLSSRVESVSCWSFVSHSPLNGIYLFISCCSERAH